jgi:crossover junction endodeoxyribonuclease RuvC
VIILGVDPSTVATGWGVLEGSSRSARAVDSGVIRTSEDAPWEDRLRALHEGVLEVIHRHGPDLLVVESTFLSKNARTALLLGQVRGVVLLAASLGGVGVREYSASEIKRAAVGNGAAQKGQVAHMMTRLLGLAGAPSHDEADALAAAWCHLVRASIPAAIRSAR